LRVKEKTKAAVIIAELSFERRAESRELGALSKRTRVMGQGTRRAAAELQDSRHKTQDYRKNIASFKYLIPEATVPTSH